MEPFDLRKWAGFEKAGGDLKAPAIIHDVAIDSRRVHHPSTLFAALPGINTDGHLFVERAATNGAIYALVNKDFPPLPSSTITLLRVASPLHALQEISAAYRKDLPCQIIAVTGSYGKTMVKDLLFKLLKTTFRCAASPESFNSQLGVPLSLFTLTSRDEIAVIEAAISEPGEIDRLREILKPDIVILTPVGKKYPTLKEFPEILSEFIKLCHTPSLKWALIPNYPPFQHLSNDPSYLFWNKPSSDLPYASKLSTNPHLTIPYQILFPDGFSYQSLITSGFYYFIDLINMTVKAAWKLGVSREKIGEVLNDYIVEPMRTELWKSPLGVTFVNDTYSQDPLSVEKGLRFLEQTTGQGRKIFLFGGLRGHHSHEDYKQTGLKIAQKNLDKLFLIGPHPFNPLIDQMQTASPRTAIIKTPTFREALERLKFSIQPTDNVLVKGEKKESMEMLTHHFHESLCTNLCFINLAAIEFNLKSLRSAHAPGTRLMVMVKALAYGTDDFRMSKFLQTCGIDIVGVSYVDEGVSLKRQHVSQSIFVLNAALYEVPKVVKWGLEVGVDNEEIITALDAEGSLQGKIIKTHLHVDTGMSRFGCRVEEALRLALLISKKPHLKLEGIMTHFPSADDPEEDAFTLEQVQKLRGVIKEIESHGLQIPWKHAANSAAAARLSLTDFNMARVGLAAYGLYASESVKKALELKQAISLQSKIAGINLCKQGDSVSYGRSYKVEKPFQRIAVLPIGYFDGLHRQYSGKGHVMIRGQKAPMVGKICMDFMMVDVTDIPQAEPGDPVLIFGEDEYRNFLPPEELAEKGSSIVHELITCLGPRIQRIFIYEEAQGVTNGS